MALKLSTKKMSAALFLSPFFDTGVAVFFGGKRVKHMLYPMISRDNITLNDVIPFLIPQNSPRILSTTSL